MTTRKVRIFGDSHINRLVFPEETLKLFADRQYDVKWYGIGGLTLDTLLIRWDTYVKPLVAEKDGIDLLILHMGSNDVCQTLADPTDICDGIKDVFTALCKAVNIRETAFISLGPRKIDPATARPATLTQTTKFCNRANRLNTKMRGLAARSKGNIRIIEGLQNLFSYLRADGVHLNDDGQKIFANMLKEYICMNV